MMVNYGLVGGMGTAFATSMTGMPSIMGYARLSPLHINKLSLDRLSKGPLQRGQTKILINCGSNTDL
jgi:hypothetical protein